MRSRVDQLRRRARDFRVDDRLCCSAPLIAVRARRPQGPLLLLGNRDEFRGRASATAQPWNEDSRIVGGRDLVAGGSWLACAPTADSPPLPTCGPACPQRRRNHADGWCAISSLGNVESSRLHRRRPCGRRKLRRIQSRRWRSRNDMGVRHRRCRAAALKRRRARDQQRPHRRALAEDRAPATAFRRGDFHRPRHRRHASARSSASISINLPDAALPDTGVGIELERLLAPVFVRGSAHYGTRASTLAYFTDDGGAMLRERGFGPHAHAESEIAWRVNPRTCDWEIAS